MVHHDFVSVFYTYYQWFTRPQRVVLLLCTVVTLMAADATVFATIMFNVCRRKKLAASVLSIVVYSSQCCFSVAKYGTDGTICLGISRTTSRRFL